MSLILAVEPDRKQAKQLSSVVRQHVEAEFVVADSGAAALAALGTRVPDLILTPALLPPKDEAVLTGWLRDLGDAAAHVQTLAIPILADASSKKKNDQGSSSIFGRLRDQQADADPGCDPGVFADQIRVYLDRAGTQRSSRATTEPGAAPQPPEEAVSLAQDEKAPEMEEFDVDVTFDDLVFEQPSEPAVPAPQVPVAEPPAVMKMPTPFARPEKRVETSVMRSWEAELGLEANPSPLWRAGHDNAATDEAARSSDGLVFDPTDSRYAPLFRRLEDVIALHA